MILAARKHVFDLQKSKRRIERKNEDALQFAQLARPLKLFSNDKLLLMISFNRSPFDLSKFLIQL